MQTDFSDLAFSLEPTSSLDQLGRLRKSKSLPMTPNRPPRATSHPAPHHYHFPSSSKTSLSSFIKNQWRSPKIFQPNKNISERHVRNYKLTDISSQNIFYLFLLESSFNYKLVITIYRTTVKENKNISIIIFFL